MGDDNIREHISDAMDRLRNYVRIEVVKEGAELIKATEGSAGFDIMTPYDFELKAGQSKKIETGLKLEIPPELMGLVLPRSGLGSQGIILRNTIGLIDPDYRGELIVNLYNENNNPTLDKKVFKKGDRIAQIIFLPRVAINFGITKKLNETERGEGGFGSSGD